MIDWDALARPTLRGLERYDPGKSRDSLRAELGLDALEPLHWNEDRFEPPRHVLDAAAAEVYNAALYPEHLFADFRDGLARWLDLPPACLTPAHGAQALISVIAQVFVGPGTPVVLLPCTAGRATGCFNIETGGVLAILSMPARASSASAELPKPVCRACSGSLAATPRTMLS